MKNRRKTVLFADFWVILYRNGMVTFRWDTMIYIDRQFVQHHHIIRDGRCTACRYPFSWRERICGCHYCATQCPRLYLQYESNVGMAQLDSFYVSHQLLGQYATDAIAMALCQEEF